MEFHFRSVKFNRTVLITLPAKYLGQFIKFLNGFDTITKTGFNHILSFFIRESTI
ncbi:hypothetical protein IMSAGC021_00267 [Muribaculaceae bacterium]|nr:hypothetical protein IMSAGC021_00267 [Muribaculaceae bacterium]